MDELKVKLLHKNAILPKRATSGSAGYDLHACLEKPVTIKPNEIVQINIGIAIAIPKSDIVGLLFARSGLAANSGVAPINCVGVIDSDYRGELIVPLINHGEKDVLIKNGDRIAQLVFTPIFTPAISAIGDTGDTQELDITARGDGRFGSTGK